MDLFEKFRGGLGDRNGGVKEDWFFFSLFTDFGTLDENKAWSTSKLSLGLLNLRNL